MMKDGYMKISEIDDITFDQKNGEFSKTYPVHAIVRVRLCVCTRKRNIEIDSSKKPLVASARTVYIQFISITYSNIQSRRDNYIGTC